MRKQQGSVFFFKDYVQIVAGLTYYSGYLVEANIIRVTIACSFLKDPPAIPQAMIRI